MTTATQPKPNPLPAILVYGTPSGPALTQASWFRAEDKEAVKAAAEALKFSVIELQTDADRALAAGAHEGVLKGSGRMIVGSVSAEVYRRIEEHVRKAAGAPDPSKPENAAATTTKPASEQNKNIGAAGPSSPGPSRATLAAPAIGKPDSAAARETLRVGAWVLADYWNEKRESRAAGSPSSSGSTHGEFITRVVRRPGISGVEESSASTSPSCIPSSASRASDSAEERPSQTQWGGLRVAPLLSAHAHEPGARPSQPPTSRDRSHDQHHRVHRRTHPRPQRRFPPHLRRRHGHDHRGRRSHAGSISANRCSRRFAPSTPSPKTTIPIANTTSARSTRAASAASGRSITTTAPPSSARPIPLIPPSPRAS